MHVHTSHSYDGRCSLRLLSKLLKKKGLNGFAFTDHDNLEALKELRLLSLPKDFLIIPGIEVTSRHGHILGLGVREAVPPHLEAEETVELIREKGGIAVAAHPFWLNGRPGAVFHARFDAVEVFNSRSYFLSNPLARRYAERKGLPMTGGSDGHTEEEVGLAYTEVGEVKGVEGVLEEIERGRTLVGGRNFPFLKYLAGAVKKVVGGSG
ncbi:MAG: PHP domain-containing protein [Candidatus Hadarchaeales archaeon]